MYPYLYGRREKKKQTAVAKYSLPQLKTLSNIEIRDF